MNKKIFIICLFMLLCLTGCGKSKFDITTDIISIYVGQKYDIKEHLEYSNNDLKDIKVNVVENNIDITKPGNYTAKIEAEAEGFETATKTINVEVKEFSSEQELCDYANKIIEKNIDTDLKCSIVKSFNSINIESIYFISSVDSNTTITVEIKLMSTPNIISYVKAQNSLNKNKNLMVLSKENYFYRFNVEVAKKDVKLNNEYYYNAKSITINSDNKSYDFGEKDSTILPNWDRSSNYGTLNDPKYDIKSILGYNLYDIDSINDVLSDDNVELNINLYKGTSSDKGETTYKVKVNEEKLEKIKSLINLEKELIYDLK